MQLGFSKLGLARLSSQLPSNHSREVIAGGNLGTAQTIRRMRDLVTNGKRDFRVRKQLGSIISRCPSKDYYCYGKAAYEFCRDQIRYVFDPNGVELIEAPYQIFQSGVADCDSIVVLLATLGEQLGFQCEFVTVRADKLRPNEFSHVYVQMKIPGHGWVAADPTMPNQQFGWRPGEGMPVKTWPASNDSPEIHDGDTMMGMGQNVVPGVQQTPGVMVSPDWNWRGEPVLVTVSPEELELDPLHQSTRQSEIGTGSDFYVAKDVGMFGMSGMNDVDEAEIVAVNEREKKDNERKVLWVSLGLAFVALYLARKK